MCLCDSTLSIIGEVAAASSHLVNEVHVLCVNDGEDDELYLEYET